MNRHPVFLLLFAIWSVSLFAADDVATAVEGTVRKIDRSAKTIAVETADGSAHIFKLADRTAVHGADATETSTKSLYHGLREGSHVVVHYAIKGKEETAEEIDDIGKGALSMTEGTVAAIDRGAKTMSVKTAEGTEETFHLTAAAARDSGKDIADGAEKATKVTVYYSEKAGEKIAHFLKKAI
jgi:hypothetical protein